MTEPTPAELREAALRLHNLVRFCSDEVKKDVDLILSRFPADGAEPITADWLREEYAGDAFDDEFAFSDHFHRFKNGELWQGRYVRTIITTRQQFRTLAGLLGIEPKRKESKS